MLKFPQLSDAKLKEGIFDRPQIRKLLKEKQVLRMVDSFRKLKCSMSLKLHFMDSHFQYFPENPGDYNKEQGERFNQDIKVVEERYKGRWDENMIADYCWMLKEICL